jgi:hypothetical protein
MSTTRVVVSAEVHRVGLFRYIGRVSIATSTGGHSVMHTDEWIGRAGAERESRELVRLVLERAAIRGEFDIVKLGLAEGVEVSS